MRHNPSPQPIVVIGAGLAGSEAAWQIAELGLDVNLFEMRPEQSTAAHKTDKCAELVCSNSFGSDSPHAASRILKDELTQLGSMVLSCARKHSVNAGASLAVDREAFASEVTENISNHPRIHIQHSELQRIPEDAIVIVATGPLTSQPLAQHLSELLGEQSLYFYDAISPIVSTDSLDLNQMFFANRYDKGETKDFLNIPLDESQYKTFIEDILSAECVLPHNFEEEKYFEGCMPIEAIAARGARTLAFGPMKPVGLHHPVTGKRAHAVIQLRSENIHGTAYNLVGCQTKMKYGEQKRIFSKLPGMENAEFLRLGSMHRNTYIHSPKHLSPNLSLRKHPRVFIAGQLTGTEGYLESCATGLLAGLNAARFSQDKPEVVLPTLTMLGALVDYITTPERTRFQPTNVNMGLFPPLEEPVRKNKKLRNEKLSERAKEALDSWRTKVL